MLPTRGSSVRRHGIGIDEIVSIHCSFSPRVVWHTHIHIQRHTQRERGSERATMYLCVLLHTWIRIREKRANREEDL